MKLRYQTILFDMDMTLLDNLAAVRAVYPLFCERYPKAHYPDQDREDRWMALYNNSQFITWEDRTAIYEAFCKEADWQDAPPFEDYWAEMMTEYARLVKPLPITIPTLISLRKMGCKLGIVTNGRNRYQSVKVEVSGLRPYVDDVINSETVGGIYKPDPRIYQIAMERLGADPETTLFVGDNVATDILGANRVGIDSFLITPNGDKQTATYCGADVSGVLDLKGEKEA